MADEQSPVQYVVSLITDLVPMPKIPKAVEALMPTLRELFQSEEILTDQRRADLSATVIQTLRRLGLEGVDIE